HTRFSRDWSSDVCSSDLDSEYKPTLILKIFLTPFGIDRPGFEFIEIIWWITVIAGFFSLLGFFTNYSLLLLSFGTTFLIGHFYRSEERRVGKECRSRW